MIFATLLLVIVISLLVNFPVAAVFLLVYKFVLLAIFPVWPVLTFWQMYGITILLSLIGSFFKNSSSGKSND